MEFIKKNFVILLAFTLPVALIVIVALSTYLPSLFISTDYNFVYTQCTEGANYYSYRCDNYSEKRYFVVNGKLAVNTIVVASTTTPTKDSNKDGIPYIIENYTVRFFLHDTKKNESREITLEEAKTLTLNNLLTSPDGITISSGYDNNRNNLFFIFGGGGSSYGHYLTKGKSRRKLNLINDGERYYYNNNFQFLGWVLPGRN